MKQLISLFCFASLLLMTACSDWFKDDEKPPLPGERVSVLQLQRNLEPVDVTLKTTGFIMPDVWTNDFWPQAGGYATHSMQHVALNNGQLKKIWEANIGAAVQTGFPITAQPVVSGGRIFTLDAASKVSAFDIRTGKKIWRNSVRSRGEDELVLGGGIAVIPEVLYVTNGYNELVALSPQSGGIFWRVKLPSPSRAAPTVHNWARICRDVG
jgi:outer membrane protein assembly factor BamB